MEPRESFTFLTYAQRVFNVDLRNRIQELLLSFSGSTGLHAHLLLDNQAVYSASGSSTIHTLGGVIPFNSSDFLSVDFPVLGLGEVTLLCSRRRAPRAPLDSNQHLSDDCESDIRLFYSLAEIVKALLVSAIANPTLVLNSLHDVMISLSAIEGAATYIEDKVQNAGSLTSEKWYTSFLKNIQTVSDQVPLGSSLVGNLLYYLTADTPQGAAKPIRRPLDLAPELRIAIGAWSRVAKRRGIEIRGDIVNPIPILGDRSQLRHLFNNLLSNAVKYSYSTTEKTEHRFISVYVRPYDPGFRRPRIGIHILNYGSGLLENEQNRIGTFGFRGSLARQEHPLGFGIGVYVAKEIARNHGGSIRYKWAYLHDTARESGEGQKIISKTYLVECIVILPIAGRLKES